MRNILNFLIIHVKFPDNLKGGDRLLNFKIVFLAALVLFASVVTTAAISFHISTPDEAWENMYSNSVVLYGGGLTPCEEIDNDGGP
jgi:hypothetical protein